MLDYVTKELPEVIDAAGIPVVCRLSRSRLIDRLTGAAVRTFLASPSLVTPWVVMVRLPSILTP